jgi:hypothetical protein
LPSRSAQSSELAMVCSSSTSHSLDHFLSYSQLSHKHRAFIIALSLSLVQVPRSFSQAIQDSKCCDAMRAEIDALEATHTWSLAELPPSKKPIGCK